MRAIHILNMNLELLGEVASYKSLRIRRKFREVGDFEMVLSLSHPMAERLGREQILCPVGQLHKAMLIEEVTRNEGTDQIHVKGYTLNGLFRRRVCVPPDGGAGNYGYDRIISDAESVMRHYIENNVISPESSARRMDCIVLETNRHRGKTNVPWSARFEQLDELLASIGTYCDSGYVLVPDLAAKKLVFTYLPGRDRTGTDGHRVTFALNMGNATGTTLTENSQQAKNAAIVGGAGEDEKRMILTVCPGGETGLDRREMFVDAGSRDDATELNEEGERRLAEKTVNRTIKAEVIDTPSCCYGEHWDLGDLVTVVARGAQMNARITQVQESHEANRAVRLEVTFGDPPGGIEKVLRDRTRTIVR